MVIPTLGRPVLSECLDALRQGSHLPKEVLVVHQGDDDATRQACEEASAGGLVCRHLPFPAERGVARARNRGIAACTTRFVLTLDDDCLASPQWLSTLVAILRADASAVLTGQVVAGGAGLAPSLKADTTARVYDAPTLRHDVLYTGNMGCSTELFWSVGAFSEVGALRPAAEDNEWAYRALRSGVPIRYEPSASVAHVGWRGAEEMREVERRYARGQGGFLGLYLQALEPYAVVRTLRELRRHTRRSLGALSRRDRAGTLSAVRCLASFLRGLGTGVRDGRRAAVLRRRVGEAARREYLSA